MGYPTYTVTWKDSNGHITDITKDVYTYPQYTDTCSEVNAALLIISADRGQYITYNPFHPSDPITYPPISDFDQINITSTDGQTGFVYAKTFEVKRRIPSESKMQGTKLEIHMLGLEWHSQVRNYAKLHFIDNAFGVGKAIQTQYNANKGTKDPEMKGLDDPNYNNMPSWTANQYDFSLNEEKSWNRLLELTDGLGMPVDAGGVFKYFEIRAISPDFVNQFYLNIFPSGDIETAHDSSTIITQSQSVNVGETEGGIDPLTGTVINAWGAPDAGSLPTGYSKFAGGKLVYFLFPQFNSTVSYPIDALVQYKSNVWKVIAPDPGHGTPGPGIFWKFISQADYYGNVYRYSEWTVDEVEKWIACGTNLEGHGDPTTYPFGRGMADMNTSVYDPDAKYKRVPVDFRNNNPDNIPTDPILKKYLYVGSPVNGFYEGTRILCDGTGAGSFAGRDKNGVPFTNNIVEYFGDTLGWIVIAEHATGLVAAVYEEGLTYVFNDILIAPNAWASLQDLFAQRGVSDPHDPNSMDCFHPYDSIINDDIDEIDPTFVINSKSAIKVTYSWTPSHLVTGPPIGVADDNWYKVGAWLTLRFPFPPNYINEPGGVVGGKYGSNITIKGPSFLDADNMTLSHNGLEGFCNGLYSEDLGPLSTFEFLIKLKATYKILGNDIVASNTDFKIRVAMRDKNDNVAVGDFIVPFNNNTFQAKLPVSGFSIYQSRKPYNTKFDYIVPPINVSPVNQFEWRHIKEITWQTLESYDSNGRYMPNSIINPGNQYAQVFKTTGAPLIPNDPALFFVPQKLEMWIDAVHFGKPLLANSETQSEDRHVEPEFIQNNDIIAYQQLKGVVKESFYRFKFPHREYDITTTLRYDIKAGDKFYYRNARIVSDSDMGPDGISENTIGLIAKRIEYSSTKPSNGFGGALRRIIGVKIFGT